MVSKSCLFTLSITLLLGQFCLATPQKPRGCKVCVSEKAPDALKKLADRIIAQQKKHATLQALSDGQAIRLASIEELLSQPWEQRAFTHLVVIGMGDDELVQQVWQNETGKGVRNRLLASGATLANIVAWED